MVCNIKTLRKSKRLTQETLAGVIHKSLPNYCMKENGQLQFSLEDALLLAKFFNTRVEKIFLLDDLQ